MKVSFLPSFLLPFRSSNPEKQGGGEQCRLSYFTSKLWHGKVKQVTLGHTVLPAETKTRTASLVGCSALHALSQGEGCLAVGPAGVKSINRAAPEKGTEQDFTPCALHLCHNSLGGDSHRQPYPASKTHPPVRSDNVHRTCGSALSVWEPRWAGSMFLRPGTEPRGLASGSPWKRVICGVRRS